MKIADLTEKTVINQYLLNLEHTFKWKPSQFKFINSAGIELFTQFDHYRLSITIEFVENNANPY